VLFDWDGTLVNSAEASFRCYVGLFARFGIAFERPHFERTYSPDWYQTYRAMGLPESRWDEANAVWLEQYREERAELLPGAHEALERLRQSGLQLGLVSAGERQRVAHEIEELGLAPRFSALVGGGDTAQRKPHPEALLLALDRLGIPAGEAAYVGDSPEDVHMARAALVYSVGIPGGFPNREALRASEPDFLAGDLQDAVGHLLARGPTGG
jgi:HAD superfamily hydrolase (TIGR01549 family)